MRHFRPKDCRELLAVIRSKALGYTYGDMVRWLKRAGCQLGPASGGGSHRVWIHPGGRRLQLTEPGSGALLPVYVKRIARILREEERCPD